MKHIHLLVLTLTFPIAQALAGTGSRLIASAHYINNNGTLTCLDSQRYLYPGTATALYNQQLTYQYSSGSLLPNLKYDYTYNAGGKLTGYTFKQWSGGTFNPKGQTAITLNAGGFATQTYNQLYMSGAYRDNTKDIYTRNAAGAVTDRVYMMWDASAASLLNHYHYAYTLNAQNNILTETLQEYDATIHWYDYSRTTCTYDASGKNVTGIKGEQYNMTTGSWFNVYQTQYTLNSTGAWTQGLMQNWSSTNAWVPSMCLTYTYDAAGNNTSITQEQWNATASAYNNYMQQTFTYNSLKQVTSDVTLYWNGTAYAVGASSRRFNYYYESYTTNGTTGVELATGAQDVRVYPTICTSRLFVESGDLGLNYALLSAAGSIVSEGKLQEGRNALETGNLAAGIYILRVIGNSSFTTYRIVRQ